MNVTTEQRAALQRLVAVMQDPTRWVYLRHLRDAVAWDAYQAILALPPELLDRLEEYETIGKVVAVCPTAAGLALVQEAAPDA